MSKKIELEIVLSDEECSEEEKRLMWARYLCKLMEWQQALNTAQNNQVI